MFLFGDIRVALSRQELEDKILSTVGMSTWLETEISGSPDGITVGTVDSGAALGEIMMGYVCCGGFTIRVDPSALPETPLSEAVEPGPVAKQANPPSFQPSLPSEAKSQDQFAADATTALTSSELEQALKDAGTFPS